LATVVFTDIVGSTEHAERLGDHRWKETLTDYDEVVHRELERFRGRYVKSTGDGILATFDGPARAIEATRAIREAVKVFGIDIRAGLHLVRSKCAATMSLVWQCTLPLGCQDTHWQARCSSRAR